MELIPEFRPIFIPYNFLISTPHLQFDDYTFDFIFSFSTLLFVKEIEETLQKIHRLLKPGGHAILDFTGTSNLSYRHWSQYYKRIGHFGLRGFNLKELNSLLSDLSFKKIEIHATGLLDQWRY